MQHLAEQPEWQDDKVVRQLNAHFPSLRQGDLGQYRALFKIRTPHRVPAAYMAMLDACG